MPDRCDVFVDRSFVRAKECRRNAMSTSAHLNRLGPKFHAGGICLRHPTIDIEQCHALTVNRDFDFLVERSARPVQLACRHGMQRGGKHVFAVGRKVVDGRLSTARALRSSLSDFCLRRETRKLVRRRGGARRRIANRKPTDCTRGIHVRIEERGRRCLRVGNIVEVRALGVERQPGAGADVDRHEILDGTLVFSPVQTLKGATARIRIGRCFGVDQLFHRFGKHNECIAAGSIASWRRHHARAQLHDHLLRSFWRKCRIRDIETGQRQIAQLATFAVTRLGARLTHDFRQFIDRNRMCGTAS